MHDWDANQIPVLADLTIDGQPRKVVMVANRNGFFYVLDRVSGKFIHAKPFVHQTWAKEIDADGRPVELPDQRPTEKGTLTCPDLFGGTNFMSPSFDPSSRAVLRVARARRARSTSPKRRPAGYKAGDRTMGGRVARAPQHPARSAARDRSDHRRAQVGDQASDAVMGWRVSRRPAASCSAATNEGEVLAADSQSGKELWRYQTGRADLTRRRRPILIDGRQYVVMPAGMTLTAFALPMATTTQ